ncbi:MAG: outer-membrane lipoprotein carrier protein LolA [candidate division Zixibacteria bacterium]
MIRQIPNTVILIVVMLHALTCAECPLFEKAMDKYQSNEFYSMDFSQLIHSDIFKSVDTLFGTIKACSDGRFHMITPNQILVSNGTVLWNYTIDNEQVIIDSITRNEIWNPIMLFFNPRHYYKCTSEKNDKTFTKVSMIAHDSLIAPNEFQLKIRLEDFIPLGIFYMDENDSRIEIYINDFRFISNLSDSVFQFIPPTGIEVIEMP